MVMLYGTSLASVICLIGLTLACFMQVSHGQDLPIDYLAPHNAARADVNVGPLTWNTTLESYAVAYANVRAGDCSLTLSGGPYPENLAWSSTSTYSAGDAVQDWVSRSAFYDYASNSCVGGNCIPYLNVVRRRSTDLGCARVSCDAGGTFVICNYYPDSFVGERPY